MASPRALILYGGWEEHHPQQFADWAETLLDGFEVERSTDLASLEASHLREFDLLLPIWTFGEITPAQEAGLLSSVEQGLGLLAWHGATSSFLHSRIHKLLLGGQFVSHPGGDATRFRVHFSEEDPLSAGLPPVEVVSEQYYFLMDPAVKVLATTVIDGAEMDWLAGVRMPVAWSRRWGQGRVVYCALGHTLDTVESPSVTTFLRRGARWAVRAGDAIIPAITVG